MQSLQLNQMPDDIVIELLFAMLISAIYFINAVAVAVALAAATANVLATIVALLLLPVVALVFYFAKNHTKSTFVTAYVLIFAGIATNTIIFPDLIASIINLFLALLSFFLSKKEVPRGKENSPEILTYPSNIGYILAAAIAVQSFLTIGHMVFSA